MYELLIGTGKTLSMICSALQWVVDQKQKQKSETVESDKNTTNEGSCGLDDEPDWMRNFVANKDCQPNDNKIKKKKNGYGLRKSDKRRNQESCRDLFSRGMEKDDFCTKKECENLRKANDGSELNDEEFLLEEYESEEEEAIGNGKSKRKAGGLTISSSIDKDEEEEDEDVSEEEEEEKLKVYFCSRTHSQLSQFIKELQKTVFASEIRVVCLGSRKIFCINEEVLKLGNSTRINERCLELQKNKNKEISKIKNLGAKGRVRQTKACSGCPMLKDHKLQKQFRSKISEQGALDIEDLVQLGKNMQTCPYYGSRSMVPAAELVVLPYQSLLSKSSRESLGLNLKNNIVIIDEAHNLADSLISMYDSKITLSQLENVHIHLEKYFGRFRSLLGPGNRRYIQTLMVLTRAFLQVLVNEKDENCVSGYGDKAASLQKGSALKDNGESCEEASILSGFRALVDMLLSLTNNDGDGRIIISRPRPISFGQQGGFLKYVMLTGEKIFSEIVDQAHAVILAGGTLQPIEETRERLFSWLPPNELHFLSCNHIIPPESILPVAVSNGPTGQAFDFSYGSRGSLTMIEELGRLLCNLVTVVPEGIVVFFTSFEYEEQVYEAWKTSGILDRLTKKKRVFREPRRNTHVESVLKEYKQTIDALSDGPKEDPRSLSGAILLAVVGGKISEGINFSDGMGRCIVMVGLPYPSPSDIELLERVKHIEGLGDSNSTKPSKISASDEYYAEDVQAGFGILRSCRRRGKEYYENLCMKAVNQSIGECS
ncbi:hypothetical protein LWI29_006303 [Acer saccharum]|uniref:Helicase ATP-binding domain-containing protein n=1 Tax=Acer saccharum TaxID=4024 RepID=A0AA39VWN2_ACESA|nr:hypothetical protein LWI29_006303 [Acer saccharum]